jgi:hypothetical protein
MTGQPFYRMVRAARHVRRPEGIGRATGQKAIRDGITTGVGVPSY